MSGADKDGTRQRGFFAPNTQERNYLSFGGRVSLPRLLVRIAIALTMLFAVDAAVARTLAPKSEYLHSYRLPRQIPTASLADYVEAIDQSAISRDGGPVVTFLGASPTYGYRTKDPANTYPYTFRAAAAADGWPSRTFNLASDGQFMADEYVIGTRLADDSDVVFVQLTYHTFNPASREGAVMRYPELPKLLGVDLTESAARLLGVKPSATARTTSQVDVFLGKRWLLWRERDLLGKRLFGGKPQALLAGPAKASQVTSLSGEAEPIDDGFAAFDSLDPGRQMIAVSRYAENARFSVSPDDSEMRFLALLTRELKAKGKKAVFFMAPLNRQLIEDYELIDARQYAANVGAIRDVVAKEGGYPFLDYNTGPDVLPSSLFADISHTTDEGGTRVGALLWRDTHAYLQDSHSYAPPDEAPAAAASAPADAGVKGRQP